MSFLTMSRGVIFLVLSLAANRGLAAVDEIIRPKVVVVTMFEPGQDTGDAPGELQYWVEREQLTRVLPLPAAYHDVRSNADGSVIGIVTGVGNSNAAASIMALGLDPRFDLRKSYWLVAGIAGIDLAARKHIHMRHKYMTGAAHPQQHLALLAHNDQGGGITRFQKLKFSPAKARVVASSTSGVG